MSRAGNPFATRYTRPGAIAYLFPAGQSAASLVDKLARQGWWGEIVGPHGSGKSTLLAALAPQIEAAGRSVAWRQIRPWPVDSADAQRVTGVRNVPAKFAAVTAGCDLWNESTQVVLDGYEQLSWWWRRRVQALVRRRGAGLLVTTHQPLGLPPLAQTAASDALAQDLVAHLLAGKESPVTPADVAAAYARTGGNVRETLFALYDVHQSRK
jgi:hypothetical protein